MPQLQALYEPVANFIDATNKHDIGKLITIFTEQAVLTDEAIEYHGKDAIRQWSDKQFIGANTTIIANEIIEIDGQIVVNFTVDGDFTKYGITEPFKLDFYFTLGEDGIQSLTIIDNLRGKETMTAVYAARPNFEDPFSGLRFGKRQVPTVPEGWVRVKVTAASLNWHDVWTLRGRGHPLLEFPRILGLDGCGTLDDGTEVILYPVMGDIDWKGDETLDPNRHVISEAYHGTLAEYVTVPQRNAILRPKGLSAITGAALGTAWLTAYRMLFTKSGLRAGQTMLVQGASGGVSTALVQMGFMAGMQVWVTGRTEGKRRLAETLGAHQTFAAGEKLPKKVDAVFDAVGAATWRHSMDSVRAGGVIVSCGLHGGAEPILELEKLCVDQISVKGSYVGTLEEFKDLISFVIAKGIEPRIGKVLPLEKAEEGLRNIWDGETDGKIVVTL